MVGLGYPAEGMQMDEDGYNPQSMVNRALIALTYYESLGATGDERALIESTYEAKYLVSSMIALVGMMVNMTLLSLAERPEHAGMSRDDLERLTVQTIRQRLIAMGQVMR